jgi:ABC-type Fe3+-hydroxamate transport system substrate-binding protein
MTRPDGRRVVSLVPSVTETLLAWGVRPVAVTRFCEQPELRAVGGTKDPDVAAIIALQPDVVVMNDEENRREDADALVAAGVSVHVTDVRAVSDVDGCLHDLSAAVGATRTRGERDAFRRIDVEPVASRTSAFVPIWRRPWMTLNADTYGSSLLALLGVSNVFADAPSRYPIVDLDEVCDHRPELILLPSEPYPFKPRHLSELEGCAAEIRFVDGRDLFWWGTRTPSAIPRLRQSIST